MDLKCHFFLSLLCIYQYDLGVIYPTHPMNVEINPFPLKKNELTGID